MRIVKIIIALLLLGLSVSGQSRRQQQPPRDLPPIAKYYFDITRPNCCSLPVGTWQRIAALLKAKGIPAFFGSYETLDYRENWKPVRLEQTVPKEGWLILGPFASPDAALNALSRLPLLLPKHGDTFRGVEKGVTSTPQTWQVGFYQIDGFKTRLPVTARKPKVPQAGTLEGVVIDTVLSGMRWLSIVVEADGVRYMVQIGGLNLTTATVGDIETVGNRVRVTYRDKQCESNGECSLEATRVVRIRK